MEAQVYLDSAYAIALAASSDYLHFRALMLANELAATKTRIVTTQAVLLEIGNALSKRRYRADAIRLLSSLLADPSIEVISLTKELFDEAFHLYRERTDKEWGLIDCISFVVMAKRGLREALTSDEHFEQAGFRALMRPQ